LFCFSIPSSNIFQYSFEGIEGTVQIATIAGSAGAFFDVNQGPVGGSQRFGFIVQSIYLCYI
jgi:hypothetical protein